MTKIGSQVQLPVTQLPKIQEKPKLQVVIPEGQENEAYVRWAQTGRFGGAIEPSEDVFEPATPEQTGS